MLTFLVFGAMISYLVYRAVTTNFELVDNEYYKKELRYQQVIDASNRTNALSSPIQLQQTDQTISLVLPTEMKNTTVEGEVYFYCAYDSRKDRRIALNTGAEGVQVINKALVETGSYIVKISWTNGGTNYYSEKSILID